LIGRDNLRGWTSDAHVRLLPEAVKVEDESCFYDVFILCDHKDNQIVNIRDKRQRFDAKKRPHHVD